jgi:hypothetical protein
MILTMTGLGTLAVKFAAIAGGTVTAFSGSESKRAACIAAGATHFVLTSDAAAMAAAAATCDVIIDTCPVSHDIAKCMDLLRFDGTYCRVGIPPLGDEAFSYSWMPTIFTQRKIAGSIVSGSLRINQMMKVVATHIDKFVCVSAAAAAGGGNGAGNGDEKAKHWGDVRVVPFSKVKFCYFCRVLVLFFFFFSKLEPFLRMLISHKRK